ncbi:MAG: hypothetical protein HXY18_00475 [Bryobacteraceae bacterium]|nr:hypothetical protein [Bryobacteraceae bacterium]
MIIRLRWKPRPRPAPNVIEITRRHGSSGSDQLVTSEEMARGLSAILWPASTVPMALALWRMGEDLGFARDFFLRDGLASKWQIWFALSLTMMWSARQLARWKAQPPETAAAAGESAIELAHDEPGAPPTRRFGNLR